MASQPFCHPHFPSISVFVLALTSPALYLPSASHSHREPTNQPPHPTNYHLPLSQSCSLVNGSCVNLGQCQGWIGYYESLFSQPLAVFSRIQVTCSEDYDVFDIEFQSTIKITYLPSTYYLLSYALLSIVWYLTAGSLTFHLLYPWEVVECWKIKSIKCCMFLYVHYFFLLYYTILQASFYLLLWKPIMNSFFTFNNHEFSRTFFYKGGKVPFWIGVF